MGIGPELARRGAPAGDTGNGHGGIPRRRWQRTYRRSLAITDTVIVVAIVVSAQAAGAATDLLPYDSPSPARALGSIALVAGLWLAILALNGTRKEPVVGSGEEEYRLVTRATLQAFGLLAIASFLVESFATDLDAIRAYLLLALPVGLIALPLGRRWCRRVVERRRVRGEFQTSVLVVGSERAVDAMAGSFVRDASAGYRVVGVCTTGYTGDGAGTITVAGHEIPVLGAETDVLRAVDLSGADTVAIAAGTHWGNGDIGDLAWELEPYRVDLVVAPGVTDIALPRLSMHPVGGLPFVHVEEPQYRGSHRLAKTVFDVVCAALALVAAAPVMLVVAALVKLHDGGPVFYRQERAGLNGAVFRMWKFRSMVVDADRMVDTVRSQSGQDGATFYKCARDPRITPVGRFIRRTSIDELPQLFNVLARDMSLVGPRPLAIGEGERIPGFVARRMLVRPGMTGLWQVSGRSDLSEADRIRLDLFYVANWSMVQDLLIIMKTVRAVLASDGAY
ncbi:sugar transferase [Rhodococcus sp. NPDC047139]|uniref:sugar transferase n=1 Tax=Rhodococcus sp. NPDC047139 TaxID=3155141 RepID=UPI0033CA1893